DGPERPLAAAIVAVAAFGGNEPFTRAHGRRDGHQQRQDHARERAAVAAGCAGDGGFMGRRVVLVHRVSRVDGWLRRGFALVWTTGISAATGRGRGWPDDEEGHGGEGAGDTGPAPHG